ncbi:hypothetical protein D3C79_794340 [compost metagenome]
MLKPVEHLRCQFVQAHQLLGQHRHKHQQQRQQQQGEQAEHHHHTPGTRKPQALETIDQRVGQVGQHDADQERRKNIVQAIKQHSDQQCSAQPDPATHVSHGKRPLPAKTQAVERLGCWLRRRGLPGCGVHCRCWHGRHRRCLLDRHFLQLGQAKLGT